MITRDKQQEVRHLAEAAVRDELGHRPVEIEVFPGRAGAGVTMRARPVRACVRCGTDLRENGLCPGCGRWVPIPMAAIAAEWERLEAALRQAAKRLRSQIEEAVQERLEDVRTDVLDDISYLAALRVGKPSAAIRDGEIIAEAETGLWPEFGPQHVTASIRVSMGWDIDEAIADLDQILAVTKPQVEAW